MQDEIFSVYGALDNLNKRLREVEANLPDYLADMLKLYQSIGALTNRVIELERKVEEILDKKE